MIAILLYVAIVFSYYLLASFDESVITNLGVEDGLIENFGAVFFFIASCLYWFCYLKSTGCKIPFTNLITKRNIFFLLLGLLFFICLGEEIRWGQDIFNWETPELLKQINDHQETSLHNIPLINIEDYQGKTSLMWMKHIHIEVLFSIFWLGYCVFLPLLSKFSPQANRLLIKICLPVPPLWIGGLFLVNYFCVHAFYSLFSNLPTPALSSFNELKESNSALFFAVLAFYETRKIVSRQQMVS